MRTIIFRDDDSSFFSSPRQLQAVYGRLWTAGLPVCLAVIPAVYADARVYWSDGNPHDPGIPPAYRGQDRSYALLDNPRLCAFLNDMAAAGLVEICLHGYRHDFFEFITHDRALINTKLRRGLAMLQEAIPAAAVNTFVPPYDRISPQALEALIDGGFHISTRSHNLAPLPQLPKVASPGAAAIGHGQALFVCDDYLFTHTRAPAESLRRARRMLMDQRLIIVSSHYWMFYHPWRGQPGAEMMAAWSAFLDDVLAADDIQVMSFSAYAAIHLDRCGGLRP